MSKYNPYEFHNNILGVHGRCIFYGDNAHAESLCLISYIGLSKKITRHNIIKLRPQAPNTPMLVQFDSLPMQWQNAIIERFGAAPKLIQKTLFEKHYLRDSEAFNFFSYFKFDDNTSLNRDKIDEYTINASVLNTVGKVYEMRYRLRKELQGNVRDIWAIIATESNRFKETTGHTLPENDRRLREKYNEYKKDGFKCLIHKNFKKKNALKVDDSHEKLLNDMFAGIEHKPTYMEVSQTYEGFLSGYVQVINNETGEIYEPKDFKKLSDSTVYNYLSKWDNKIGTFLQRSGDRQKYMAQFKPYHKLLQPKFAGSLISIDDRQPVFEYEKGKRLWFYNGIDLGSEAFTCWVYGKTKEGIILDFYRQMVRNYAQWGLSLPAELEGELSLNSSFKDTFLQEGNMFRYVRIEANNARGKRIEQYYRPLRYQYEKKREGWLARPFALSEANQASGEQKKLIPYEEIVEGCLLDIQNWNNSEHSKIKGMSRWDVFLSMQHPDLKPINYHGILPYLGYRAQSSVNAGIINFRNTKFLLGMDGVISVGNKLINLMTQAEGKDIDIYWLDDNFGGVLKAHIYIGNQFICEAIEMPGYNRARIEQTDEDMINRELMSKYTNTIESFGRRVKNNLDKVTVIDNRPVTIGNSFVMPGLKTFVQNTEPAKVLAGFDDDETEFNSPLNGNNQSFKRSLISSF
jgi:hypothetical protein